MSGGDLTSERPKINMDGLSFDAKVIAGCCFGAMGSKSSMTFEMREAKPTARMQAALDELVAAGVLGTEIINGYGGTKYRPLHNCHEAFVWVAKLAASDREQLSFPLSEPIEAA